jgi:hypothetical protein
MAPALGQEVTDHAFWILTVVSAGSTTIAEVEPSYGGVNGFG